MLVQFWSSSDHSSRKEAQNLLGLYGQFHERGLEVVGISQDGRSQKAIDFINGNEMVWPQYADAQGKLAKRYKVSALPATFVLDRQRRIIAWDLKGAELQRVVSSLFSK